LGSRVASMNLIADFLGDVVGRTGEIGRRVVDQTGLTGLWDFTLETAWPTQTPPQDAGLTGPTMLEAIQEQLGMKLKPTRALVSEPVVDHVERPNEN